MEINLTQEQLREVVLAALLDYENLKKNRRIKAVKKTLQGTMVATIIGSTSVIAANQGRNNQVKDVSAIMSTGLASAPVAAKFLPTSADSKFIPAVAHFANNSHQLNDSQIERLHKLIQQIPKNSEITVIGRTDKSGGYKFNNKLGKLRARAVAEVMQQHGLKIKTIVSKISNDMPENWMERRVDILVDSSSGPFFLNLTSQDNQNIVAAPRAKSKLRQEAISAPNTGHVSEQPAPMPKIVAPALAPKAKQPAQTVKAVDEKQNAPQQIIAQPFTGTEKHQIQKLDKVKIQTKNIQGVVHFPLNGYELTLTQQQELSGFIKQLSKDKELIVIGRTESSGAENTIEKLGLLRAKSVAYYLANNGLKVVAVGSKKAHEGLAGWQERRVDIIVD